MKNSEPNARGCASHVRRFEKNPAATRNATAATAHHNAGRHAYSPTAMPAPNANAAQNNGRRGGLIAGENSVTSVLENTSLVVVANPERVRLFDFEARFDRSSYHSVETRSSYRAPIQRRHADPAITAPSGPQILPHQLHHALDVIGLWKQIHQMQPFRAPTTRDQRHQVARQSRRIARHVRHALCVHLRHSACHAVA